MLNAENLHEVIRRYEARYDVLNDTEHDEIFKWDATQHCQNVWYAPDAETRPFSELLSDALKNCSVLINNAYTCPASGVVKIAEQRPDEVEHLFRQVLLAEDHGDLELRQENTQKFEEGMNALCQEIFPTSFKFKQDRHAAMCYRALLRPDEDFMYQYAPAEEFAKHMEFGLDLGSGSHFQLKHYYALCQETADFLREEGTLQKMFQVRMQSHPGMYYPDKELHLLTFELIRSAAAYRLYDGIEHRSKADCIRRYQQDQAKQQQIQMWIAESEQLQAEIQALELQMEPIRTISLLNVEVDSNQHGTGRVTAQEVDSDMVWITVRFAGCQQKYALHEQFHHHPTFEDDKHVIAAFTAYGRLLKDRETLDRKRAALESAIADADASHSV